MSIESLENIAKREENVRRLGLVYAAGLGLAIFIVVAALVIAI